MKEIQDYIKEHKLNPTEWVPLVDFNLFKNEYLKKTAEYILEGQLKFVCEGYIEDMAKLVGNPCGVIITRHTGRRLKSSIYLMPQNFHLGALKANSILQSLRFLTKDSSVSIPLFTRTISYLYQGGVPSNYKLVENED